MSSKENTEFAGLIIRVEPHNYYLVESKIQKISQVKEIEPIIVEKNLKDRRIIHTENRTYETLIGN